MIRTHGDSCKEPCAAEYAHNVGLLEADIKQLNKSIESLKEKLYLPAKKTYTACPNYLAPFDGWLVTADGFIKKFTGPRAQLDAQMLVYLLNDQVSDGH